MKISGSDLHLLTIFDAVVRSGGFSAAQAELGLSQSTISNHISALEQRLGVTLCKRGRSGFQLTDKGRVVHEIGQNLDVALDHHSAILAELKGALAGTLRIGTVNSIASDENMKLPQALFQFAQSAPMVKVELSQETPQTLLTKIINGQLHAGIGGFDNPMQGLKFERIYTEKHSLYCGARHPQFYTTEGQAPVFDIDEYAHVNRRYWSRRRRQSLSIKETDVMVNDIESQLLLVLSGRYLGLLPDHLAQPYVKRGELCVLPREQFEYLCEMQIVIKSGTQPRMVNAFRKAVLEAHSA